MVRFLYDHDHEYKKAMVHNTHQNNWSCCSTPDFPTCNTYCSLGLFLGRGGHDLNNLESTLNPWML